MNRKKSDPSAKLMWAYGYKIVPPRPADQLSTIQVLLEREHATARLGARTWEGRLVLDQEVTDILVVTDSPDQSREINRRLEAELKALKTGFMMTAPMAVIGDAAPQATKKRPSRRTP